MEKSNIEVDFLIIYKSIKVIEEDKINMDSLILLDQTTVPSFTPGWNVTRSAQKRMDSFYRTKRRRTGTIQLVTGSRDICTMWGGPKGDG